MTEQLKEAFFAEYISFIEFFPRLIIGLIALIVVYIVGKGLASGVLQILKRSSFPSTYHSFFSKLIKGVALFLGVILFLNLIGYGTLAASLLAGGGLTAVMLGFAFKDIGENFLAGFFLVFSRPFNKNDVIETDGITGTVKEIQLRHTHIRTAEGCDVFVPSAQLFTKPLFNYTLDGLRRGSFTVGIDYSNDAAKAIEILLEITNTTTGVLDEPKSGVSVSGLMPSYIELSITFWINAKDQEHGLAIVRSRLMNRIKNALRDHGYTLSSDVTTALTMETLDVSVSQKEESKS
jgi:small-conductance mechanosensitive channel